MITLEFRPAHADDAPALAALKVAAARALTEQFGRGHWSGEATERGVQLGIDAGGVWAVRSDGGEIIGTFRLATKKPWAIDKNYFAPVRRPLYLTDMAVAPERQSLGVGRRCVSKAVDIARAFPADAIRLDAYDDAAGAGTFYEKCGFTPVGRASFRGTPLLYYELLITTHETNDPVRTVGEA